MFNNSNLTISLEYEDFTVDLKSARGFFLNVNHAISFKEFTFLSSSFASRFVHLNQTLWVLVLLLRLSLSDLVLTN